MGERGRGRAFAPQRREDPATLPEGTHWGTGRTGRGPKKKFGKLLWFADQDFPHLCVKTFLPARPRLEPVSGCPLGASWEAPGAPRATRLAQTLFFALAGPALLRPAPAALSTVGIARIFKKVGPRGGIVAKKLKGKLPIFFLVRDSATSPPWGAEFAWWGPSPPRTDSAANCVRGRRRERREQRRSSSIFVDTSLAHLDHE